MSSFMRVCVRTRLGVGCGGEESTEKVENVRSEEMRSRRRDKGRDMCVCGRGGGLEMGFRKERRKAVIVSNKHILQIYSLASHSQPCCFTQHAREKMRYEKKYVG